MSHPGAWDFDIFLTITKYNLFEDLILRHMLLSIPKGKIWNFLSDRFRIWRNTWRDDSYLLIAASYLIYDTSLTLSRRQHIFVRLMIINCYIHYYEKENITLTYSSNSEAYVSSLRYFSSLLVSVSHEYITVCKWL